jgi:hypothetical protein
MKRHTVAVVGSLAIIGTLAMPGAAARNPRAGELAAMKAALARSLCGRCVGWKLEWGRFRISSVDEHFGSGVLRNGSRKANGEELQSGYALLFRVKGRWRVLDAGQADVGCNQMPRIVRRDLGFGCSREPRPPP